MHIEKKIVRSGFDGKTCWVHARPAVIPAQNGNNPVIIITAYPLKLTGDDVFFATHTMYSEDMGETWTDFIPSKETLGRKKIAGGLEEVPCDLMPSWHEATQKVFVTGQTAVYKDDELTPGLRPRSTIWSVLDPNKRTWSNYQKLVMPDAEKFFNSGAGSTQRVDLPNGDILLPIYFCNRETTGVAGNLYCATVMRCSFDGVNLRYIEHGSELSIGQGRGLYEPSLCTVKERYFLTMRNDDAGYVSSSDDGLNFCKPKVWTFEDGSDLGNYNTQQHWLVYEDKLFLIYTRRGANNDNVFRHRAPLFIAEVDIENLCVIRHSELELVPNRGARLGNFGVTRLSQNEYLVVVSEWMQTKSPNPHDYKVCQKYGSDNSIFMVKVTF